MSRDKNGFEIELSMKHQLDISGQLKEFGVTPTSIRILVYRCLDDSETPLSLMEIESRLDSVDKSTVSRTLSTFKKHHMVHSLYDGSGSVKYELCRTPHDECDDRHVHFHCDKCGKTICLTGVAIPSVKLPDGYQPFASNYVISGFCPSCS